MPYILLHPVLCVLVYTFKKKKKIVGKTKISYGRSVYITTRFKFNLINSINQNKIKHP